MRLPRVLSSVCTWSAIEFQVCLVFWLPAEKRTKRCIGLLVDGQVHWVLYIEETQVKVHVADNSPLLLLVPGSPFLLPFPQLFFFVPAVFILVAPHTHGRFVRSIIATSTALAAAPYTHNVELGTLNGCQGDAAKQKKKEKRTGAPLTGRYTHVHEC